MKTELKVLLLATIIVLTNQCSICSNGNTTPNCLIVDFDQFEDLKFNCEHIPFENVLIKPKNELLINDKLNFKGLNLKTNEYGFTRIVLNNVKGLELISNPFARINTIDENLIVYQFIQSRFEFYYNNSRIKPDFTITNHTNFLPLFFSGSIVNLLLTNDVTYSDLSPNIFKNAFVKSLDFLSLFNSLVGRNLFTFKQQVKVFNLNSTVIELIIIVYNIKLDNTILDRNVFKRLVILNIENYPIEIHSDLVKTFKNIRLILLKINNLRSIFYQGMKWINQLNRDILVDLNDTNISIDPNRIVYLMLGNGYNYIYSEEDFCLFVHFPFKQLIFPISLSRNFTCTFVWLIQFFNLYKTPTNFYGQYVQDIISAIKNPLFYSKFYKDYNKCQFEQRIQKCDLNFTVSKSALIRDLNDHYYEYNSDRFQISSKLISFLINVVLLPVAFFSGMIFSLLVIVTLSNKNYKKNFKAKMFDSILINAVINLIACFIYSFQIIAKCIEPEGIYCPIIRRSVVTQYMFVIVVNYFGSVLKLCSNLTSILIAFNRFMMATESKNRILNKMNNFSNLTVIIIVLTISLSLSAIKLFQYKVNNPLIYEDLLYVYSDIQYPFPNVDFLNTKHIYIYLNSAYHFICSILTPIIILIFDIKLILFVKISIRKKSKLIKGAKNNLEIRTTLMVIFTCCVFLVTNSFEFVFSIMNILSNIYDRDLFKASIFRCDEIHSFFCGFLREDFALLFYFSSYSLFFFLFYKFNAKFKESFVDIMVKLKLMKKKTKVIELFKLEI